MSLYSGWPCTVMMVLQFTAPASFCASQVYTPSSADLVEHSSRTATESTNEVLQLSPSVILLSFLYHCIRREGALVTLHSRWSGSPCFTNVVCGNFSTNSGGSAKPKNMKLEFGELQGFEKLSATKNGMMMGGSQWFATWENTFVILHRKTTLKKICYAWVIGRVMKERWKWKKEMELNKWRVAKKSIIQPFTNKLVVHFTVPASLLTWQEYVPLCKNPTE